MPNSAVALIAIGLAIAAGYGALRIRKWYQAERQQAEQTVGAFLKMLPALAEHEQFFKLLDYRGPKSHYLERHGPMLRRTDLGARATTGSLEVAGHHGDPVTSTRWLNHADLLLAGESALDYWSQGERPANGVFKFEFPEVVGEGYMKNSSKRFTTKIAKVVVRKGEVITAFPTEA
jgi:hypothetical protein